MLRKSLSFATVLVAFLLLVGFQAKSQALSNAQTSGSFVYTDTSDNKNHYGQLYITASTDLTSTSTVSLVLKTTHYTGSVTSLTISDDGKTYTAVASLTGPDGTVTSVRFIMPLTSATAMFTMDNGSGSAVLTATGTSFKTQASKLSKLATKMW